MDGDRLSSRNDEGRKNSLYVMNNWNWLWEERGKCLFEARIFASLVEDRCSNERIYTSMGRAPADEHAQCFVSSFAGAAAVASLYVFFSFSLLSLDPVHVTSMLT